MRITQKDIARELGISLITVNRALNNSGYVSDELKRRILELVEKRSYVPHKASQALVRNRVRNLAVFSSSLPDYFWGDIRKGIDIAAQQIVPFNYAVRYHTIPESDTGAYIRTLEKEIAGGLEAAAFANQRLYDMRTIFAMADRAGIPYITFNVDAPESNRICYIGSDYRAGGRLAAEFIGNALRMKPNGRVLAISSNENESRFSAQPDINTERLDGFLAVLQERYPGIDCDVELVTTKLEPGCTDSQIEDLLRGREGKVDAVYLMAAFNSLFLQALEKLDYRAAVTVLHDIDGPAVHHLETGLLSGVIYQNPILQGYYTVKTLEHIVESSRSAVMNDIEIVHNLILAENRHLSRNHYAMTQLLE